jgi:hypothetical protein
MTAKIGSIVRHGSPSSAAMAVALWFGCATAVHAANCTTGSPSFQIDLTAQSAAPLDICQSTPIGSMSIAGPGAVGSATARSSVGSLGASAKADNSFGAAAGAGAHARFIDDFPILLPGAGTVTLTFTVDLTGLLMGSGSSVTGVLDVHDTVMFSGGGANFSAQGSKLVASACHSASPTQSRSLRTWLPARFRRQAAAWLFPTSSSLSTSPRSNCSNPAGNLVDSNVVLTDDVGQTIPVAAPPPGVPEPSTSLVLLTAAGSIAVCLRRRARRPGTEAS